MPKRQSVILVESSFIIQSGIEQLLLEIPGMFLTEIFDGTEKKLSEKIQNKKPDIIIINPDLFNRSLTSIVNQLNKKDIILIGLINNHTPNKLRSPFRYCLTISDDKYELLEVLKNITGKNHLAKTRKQTPTALSEREKTILIQVVGGLTNQEIANKLFLSIHTVTTHRKNISRKLGIKTVSGLTVYALMNGVVELDDIEQK